MKWLIPVIAIIFAVGCEEPWADDDMSDNEADVAIVKALSERHDQFIYNGRSSANVKNDTVDGPIVNRGSVTNGSNNTAAMAVSE